MGGPNPPPPPPLSAKNQKLASPPRPPPLVRKNQKFANNPPRTPPLPPLVRNHIWTTPINLVKPIFQEGISNFEIYYTCVKYKKEKKEHLRQKIE